MALPHPETLGDDLLEIAAKLSAQVTLLETLIERPLHEVREVISELRQIGELLNGDTA